MGYIEHFDLHYYTHYLYRTSYLSRRFLVCIAPSVLPDRRHVEIQGVVVQVYRLYCIASTVPFSSPHTLFSVGRYVIQTRYRYVYEPPI